MLSGYTTTISPAKVLASKLLLLHMSEKNPSVRDDEGGSGTSVSEKTRVQIPKNFKVLLLNDDYTPMDFVVAVLESIFRKSPAEAVQVMLAVHNQGKGLCGVYTKQIAETKVELVHQQAQEHRYPLKCVMEEA